MAFQSFKTIAEVLQQYTLRYSEEDFIEPTSPELPSELLRKEVDFSLREMSFNNSEHAICESLIFPVLRDIWREDFMRSLVLWSHQTLRYDNVLQGVPDYLIARRSPLGKVVFEKPFLAVIEAKKDDFDKGWAQCAAGMLAAQKLNGSSDGAVLGIVTNGKMWECGKLEGTRITKHASAFSIYNLNELTSALRYLFQECERFALLDSAPLPQQFLTVSA